MKVVTKIFAVIFLISIIPWLAFTKKKKIEAVEATGSLYYANRDSPTLEPRLLFSISTHWKKIRYEMDPAVLNSNQPISYDSSYFILDSTYGNNSYYDFEIDTIHPTDKTYSVSGLIDANGPFAGMNVNPYHVYSPDPCKDAKIRADVFEGSVMVESCKSESGEYIDGLPTVKWEYRYGNNDMGTSTPKRFTLWVNPATGLVLREKMEFLDSSHYWETWEMRNLRLNFNAVPLPKKLFEIPKGFAKTEN